MKCNICDSDIEEDNGDIVGNFGISPVAFCVWCMSSMTDMVIQLNGFNDINYIQFRFDMFNTFIHIFSEMFNFFVSFHFFLIVLEAIAEKQT